MRLEVLPAVIDWSKHPNSIHTSVMERVIALLNGRLKRMSEYDYPLPLDQITREAKKVAAGKTALPAFCRWWKDVIVDGQYFRPRYELVLVSSNNQGGMELARKSNRPERPDRAAVGSVVKYGEVPPLTTYVPAKLDNCVAWRQVGAGYYLIIESGKNEYALKLGSKYGRGAAQKWAEDHPGDQTSRDLSLADREDMKGISCYAVKGGIWHYDQLVEDEVRPTTYVQVQLKSGKSKWVCRSSLNKSLGKAQGEGLLLARMDEVAAAFPDRPVKPNQPLPRARKNSDDETDSGEETEVESDSVSEKLISSPGLLKKAQEIVREARVLARPADQVEYPDLSSSDEEMDWIVSNE